MPATNTQLIAIANRLTEKLAEYVGMVGDLAIENLELRRRIAELEAGQKA